MKRIICMLLCAVLLLAACGKEPGTGETTTAPAETTVPVTTAPETTAPPETTPEAVQLPMSAIFMPLVTEESYAEDGTLLFSTTYQDVSMTMPDTDCAEEIILDLLRRIDDSRKADKQLLSWAQDDYTGQDGWVPYASEIVYAPVRMDEKVLSLYGISSSYGGGVHPNYACISASYDLVTGKALALEDVLVDKAAADTLCDMILDELAAIKDDYYLFDDYDRTVQAYFGTVYDDTWTSTGAWVLGTEGLGVYFSPYDIAPYASGVIELVFPYDALSGVIDPDYIPATLPSSVPGTVEAVLAQDVELDSFTQFAEAILDADGEQVILHTQGLVTDLTLELGTWDEDGIYFSPKATVFAANTLTPGDAVMLQTMFSDTMPHLRLRYVSGGTEYSYFLTQSGKDGSIILMEDLT